MKFNNLSIFLILSFIHIPSFAEWEHYSYSRNKQVEFFIDRDNIIDNGSLKEVPLLLDYATPRGPEDFILSMIHTTNINCDSFTARSLSIEFCGGKKGTGQCIGPLKATEKDKWGPIQLSYLHKVARELCHAKIEIPKDRLAEILNNQS